MSLSIQQAKESGISNVNISKHLIVGVTLTMALFAFEIFNFDTTRYALSNLLGDKEFATFTWAGILAVAFCAIDFAGLAKIFTPEQGRDEPTYVWYLMGAWLIGATMNAVMTWWAVSITLLESPGFGNEVLSREQILNYVPIFVAVLVWLTRILFIGALSIAGDQLFDLAIPERALTAESKRKSNRHPQYVSRQKHDILPNLRGTAVRHRSGISRGPARSTRRSQIAPAVLGDEENEPVYEEQPTLILEPHQIPRAASANTTKPPKRSPQRPQARAPKTSYRRKPMTRPTPRPRPQQSMMSERSQP
ncbi:MAG: hypothetical protein ACPG8W_05135 [Candidatus Promineifilaceae bacterium]